jgi:hypothetical protein
VSRRQRRTAVIGKGAPVEIGGRLGAGEHEQRSRKLVEESVEAMGGRWLLPTVASSSPEGRSGRR